MVSYGDHYYYRTPTRQLHPRCHRVLTKNIIVSISTPSGLIEHSHRNRSNEIPTGYQQLMLGRGGRYERDSRLWALTLAYACRSTRTRARYRCHRRPVYRYRLLCLGWPGPEHGQAIAKYADIDEFKPVIRGPLSNSFGNNAFIIYRLLPFWHSLTCGEFVHVIIRVVDVEHEIADSIEIFIRAR